MIKLKKGMKVFLKKEKYPLIFVEYVRNKEAAILDDPIHGKRVWHISHINFKKTKKNNKGD